MSLKNGVITPTFGKRHAAHVLKSYIVLSRSITHFILPVILMARFLRWCIHKKQNNQSALKLVSKSFHRRLSKLFAADNVI